MPVKCKDVIEIMNRLAPPCLTLKNDNTGLMIGSEDAEVSSILVSLDISDDVCMEAAEKECSLIVTHHPFIFHPLNRIDFKSPRGRMIEKLISGSINVFSAHTNLDIADGGINDYLANNLNLSDIEVLDVTCEEAAIDIYPLAENKKYGLGRIGFLSTPLTLKELCARVKSLLKIDDLDVVGDMNRVIRRVALCSGSGAEYIEAAVAAGCDAYLTGDIRYHDACDARDMGIALIDGGHFATESVYMGYLADYLRKQIEKKDSSVAVYLSTKNRSPFLKV